MKWYSRSREDFIEQLYIKYKDKMPIKSTLRDFRFKPYKKMSEIREDPGCLTLSEDMMDERDFKAEEAIKLDLTVELPKSFSLWKWIRKTNYQNGRGSCTANATSHGVQVLAVKDKGVEPTKENIVTPDRKDLWGKMWHNLDDKNDSGDYVEKAINTALKLGIATVEWDYAKFDGYSYDSWNWMDRDIDKMKRYLYKGCPIAWCLRWNKTTWNELTNGQLKTYIEADKRTGWHAICLVGWDEWGLRFVNSRKTNDGKWYKSRFYVTYADLKLCSWMFNWRYRPLFKKEQAKKDPEYIKRKNVAVVVLKALKKQYDKEPAAVKEAIVKLSQAYRKAYPEINEELPLK